MTDSRMPALANPTLPFVGERRKTGWHGIGWFLCCCGMGQLPDLEFTQVGAGAVAVMHRPKLTLLPALRSSGVTHLVTLLSRREGALVIGRAAEAAGLTWVWVELPNGRQPPAPLRRTVVAGLAELAEGLRAGARVVVHCSAGIHRTGMFTYALLRTCQLDAGDALAALTRMRRATAEGVGDQRLEWAEQLAAMAETT